MIQDLFHTNFAHPGFFALFALIGAGIYLFWKFQGMHFTQMRMSSLAGVEGTQTLRSILRQWLPILRILALACLIIALARPQDSAKEEKVDAEGIDIALVMDLSSSMLAQDFKPDRLEVSKRVAIEFVEKRPYDRISLVVFAGEAYTKAPLTSDHRILKKFLSELECGKLEDGTAIGMGLATAVNRLKDSDAKSKVIILLTDGDNNAGYIQPITAAEMAQLFDINVYTIGVGSRGRALAPVARGSNGQFKYGLATVRIDEALLQEISEMTGGRSYRATSEEKLEQIYAEIDQLEKTVVQRTILDRKEERFHHWAMAAFILVLIEFILRHTWLRTIP